MAAVAKADRLLRVESGQPLAFAAVEV